MKIPSLEEKFCQVENPEFCKMTLPVTLDILKELSENW